MTEQSQTIKINFCECCKYQAKTKFNFNKHLATKKHIKNSNTEPLTGPICVELKIKKEKKLKPVMVEMETQTDACDEEQCVDVIELENKNMILEEENNELRNELKEKCEEFEAENQELKDENARLLKIIAELNAKNNQEIVDEMKRDIDGYLFDIKEKDEEIEELKMQLKIKNEMNDDISAITECTEFTECKTECKSECVDEIIELKKLKIPPRKSKKELEMEKKIRELENENKDLKHENIKINISNYENSPSNSRKNSRKNRKSSDGIVRKSEIQEMCNNANINPYIKNYCEKNFDNTIITRKILKSVDLFSYSKNSDKIYFEIFKNIIDEIPDDKKPFVCIDSKRKLYSYYDEVAEKWKTTNKSENMNDFEKYLKYIFSYINNSLMQALLNTKDLDNKAFKENYQKNKDTVFGREDKDNFFNELCMLMYCNLFDSSCEKSFMKHALVLCSKIKAIKEKKKSKKHKKSKRYESDSESDSESESESDSEDEYEYDD